MAIPSTPANLYVQQGNGQVYLSWDLTATSTSYQVQRSLDGVSFSIVGSPTVNNYTDLSVVISTQYYYQVAATNGSGTSAYTAAQVIIPTAPGTATLGNIRLMAQQRADQVNSSFLSLPEWNSNISASYKELYDLLVQKYGDDYYYTVPISYTTTGQINSTYQAQVFPLPDGISVTDAGTTLGFTGNTHSSTLVDGLSSISGLTVGQIVTGSGIPSGAKIVSIGGSSITLSMAATATATGVSLVAANVSAAFYKSMLVEVALNPGDPNSWVTLKKYQRIQQNLWNFPNVYTFYGITNLRYRITGTQLQIVPICAAGQTLRMWYAPRPLSLVKDTDTIDGVSGWEEYIVIDAAIKAMQKEESDCQELMLQKAAMIARINSAAENRDVGLPETVSDSRMRNFAWADEGDFGGGGMW